MANLVTCIKDISYDIDGRKGRHYKGDTIKAIRVEGLFSQKIWSTYFEKCLSYYMCIKSMEVEYGCNVVYFRKNYVYTEQDGYFEMLKWPLDKVPEGVLERVEVRFIE